MMRARGVVLLLALVQVAGAVRLAGAEGRRRTVAAVALPARGPQGRSLLPRAERVALGLERSLGAAPAPAAARPELAADTLALVARGRELYRAGDLDRAARVLDEGLETAAREPQRFGGSEELVAAQVDRITIALARGEGERAALLLERLLRWDPTFSPADGEGSPRLHEALAEVRTRVPPAPPLRGEDVGGACALADILVVARPARGGRIELARLDHCQLAASTVVAPLAVDTAIEALGGRADALTPAATDSSDRPLIKRPWFWAAIGAAALAVTAVAIWRLPDSPDQADVVPHL